jgi:hypothetical protein
MGVKPGVTNLRVFENRVLRKILELRRRKWQSLEEIR